MPGVFKLRFSIRGWLASSVLMDAARFLVIGPRGELEARFGGSGTVRSASLVLVAMVDWPGLSGRLERGRFLWDEASTSVIMGAAQTDSSTQELGSSRIQLSTQGP